MMYVQSCPMQMLCFYLDNDQLKDFSLLEGAGLKQTVQMLIIL